MNTRTPIDCPTIVLIGPTAVGKTGLSIKLAHQFNCEIISMDSMQVYRYMDIGTAKISSVEMEGIPHHLINVVNPDDDYDTGRYVNDVLSAINHIQMRGKIPLITGGTGLYLKSLVEGLVKDIPTEKALRDQLKKRLLVDGPEQLFQELEKNDPETANRIHINDHYRLLRALEIHQLTGIPWSNHIREQKRNNKKRFTKLLEIGLTCSRKQLYDRIDKRTLQMIEHGLEGEVRRLLDMGYSAALKPMKSLGYRHMVNYLVGNWNMEQTIRLLARDTRHYAKRQFTWFNKSKSINWFDVTSGDNIFNEISRWFSLIG